MISEDLDYSANVAAAIEALTDLHSCFDRADVQVWLAAHTADAVLGYRYAERTYCRDCAYILDLAILHDGQPITEADVSSYPSGCCCDACGTILFDGEDMR